MLRLISRSCHFLWEAAKKMHWEKGGTPPVTGSDANSILRGGGGGREVHQPETKNCVPSTVDGSVQDKSLTNLYSSTYVYNSSAGAKSFVFIASRSPKKRSGMGDQLSSFLLCTQTRIRQRLGTIYVVPSPLATATPPEESDKSTQSGAMSISLCQA